MKNTNKKPLVSVVMPVRNVGNFILEAIASILNQTYKKLEIIVVDDASTDDTYKILKSLNSKRIKIIRNKHKLGVTSSANAALKRAKGDFIARMDGDDVADPKRIEKQIAFLLKNPEVVAVGGQCKLINSEGIQTGIKTFPTSDKKIKEMIFSNVPVQQPALMVAVGRLPKNFAWYDENYESAEELELLFKLFQFGKIANLKDFVLKYRIHGENTSLKNPKKTFFLTLKTRLASIKKYNYRPSIKSILITLAQTVVILMIPESSIYPLYTLIRGIYKFDVNSIYKKDFKLAEG